jgi:hypothetical protein
MTETTSSLILNGLTFLLAGGTLWMAWATHRMATATRDMLDLESRPYLVFRDLRIAVHRSLAVGAPSTDPALETRIRIALDLTNSGKSELEFEVEELRASVATITNPSPRFHVRKVTLAPQQGTFFWFDDIVIPGEIPVPSEGFVDFRIRYNSTNRADSHRLQRRVRVNFLEREPILRWDTLFLE